MTSEAGYNQDGSYAGQNVFSIQLNTNSGFSTPACQGRAGCGGWVQFDFNNYSGVFLEYWLLGYGTDCPKGWFIQAPGVPNCGINFGFSAPSGQKPILAATELQNVSMQATAVAGGMDTVTLFNGSTSIGSYSAPDSTLSLAGKWTSLDFNLYGIGDFAKAVFNPGVTLVTTMTYDDNTSTAPACDINGSSTGEDNNLSPVAPCCASGGTPQVSWTQSNVPGAISQCACHYSTYCPFYQNQPPTYNYQCSLPVDFYSASGKSNLSVPTGLNLLAKDMTLNSGSTGSNATFVSACALGTVNQCTTASTEVAESAYCHTSGGGGGGGGVTSCRQCTETGRQCKIVNGRPTCVGVIQ